MADEVFLGVLDTAKFCWSTKSSTKIWKLCLWTICRELVRKRQLLPGYVGDFFTSSLYINSNILSQQVPSPAGHASNTSSSITLSQKWSSRTASVCVSSEKSGGYSSSCHRSRSSVSCQRLALVPDLCCTAALFFGHWPRLPHQNADNRRTSIHPFLQAQWYFYKYLYRIYILCDYVCLLCNSDLIWT